VLKIAETMLEEGAAILDIGGNSTRPGAMFVDQKEELRRIVPVVEWINKRFPESIISIDTVWSSVASEAIDRGASIINDISAGEMDPDLWKLASKQQVAYVLMHMQGKPVNMQRDPKYQDVVAELMDFFLKKKEKLKAAGVNNLILDPGFGFGKTVDHNYEILRKLEYFQQLDLPILAGISRKSMINKILDVLPTESMNGTTVVNTLAILKGANILRVHDVKLAVEAIKITSYYTSII
ncbi:MAG: dihydropteroate synthase, partial [Bacteroidetes bacterium]|nr:dihydropteroate synthase [Bacteroidota bacterium]